MSEFRDFIPAGEDTGAQTGSGYADFVPTKAKPAKAVVAPDDEQGSTDTSAKKEVAPKAK